MTNTTECSLNRLSYKHTDLCKIVCISGIANTHYQITFTGKSKKKKQSAEKLKDILHVSLRFNSKK